MILWLIVSVVMSVIYGGHQLLVFLHRSRCYLQRGKQPKNSTKTAQKQTTGRFIPKQSIQTPENMSDALGSFLTDLLAESGRRHISIISDNAKRSHRHMNGRRRRAPRRSASSPLQHMSNRWESPSKFDFDSISAGTSPVRNRAENKNCRWESMKTENSVGLTRPRRQTSGIGNRLGTGATPLPDISRLRNQRSYIGRSNELTTSSLPKSLRSLPY